MAQETSLTAYGLFSREDGQERETLYNVFYTPETAFAGLGKYVCFQVFGDIAFDKFVRMVARLYELAGAPDLTKCAKVGGLTYYIRILTEAEAKSLVDFPTPQV